MATQSLNEETTKKVIRQVEFYFSDSNLPRDKFLRNTVNESEDGLVSLALICSFSRMRSHLELGDAKPEEISEDTLKAVAEALRISTFLKVSEDGKKIGRLTDLPKPEEVIVQLDVRTIAASPLAYDTKLEDVELFFGQFAKVTSVRLPRHVADKKLLCGTALIEFSKEEDALKVLKENITYQGVKLELNPKKDFDIERAKHEEEFAKNCSQKGSPNHKDVSIHENYYPKGLIIAFKLKPISSDSSEVINSNMGAEKDTANDSHVESELSPTEMVTEEDKDDEKKSEENSAKAIERKIAEKVTAEGKKVGDIEEKEEGIKEKVEINSAMGMYKDNNDVVMREDLKSIFSKFGTVKFIDFKIGEESGYIRFEDEEAGQKARAAAALTDECGLTVKNYIAVLDPVTGEAEKEYWGLLRGSQDKVRDGNGGNRGRGGRFNRGGGRHGKHGRSRENSNSSYRSNKMQKV